MRSDALGHQEIAAMLGVRVIPLELVDGRYYHLDTCFCPLSEDRALYFPGAFDEYGQAAIEQHIPARIEVTREEAERLLDALDEDPGDVNRRPVSASDRRPLRDW